MKNCDQELQCIAAKISALEARDNQLLAGINSVEDGIPQLTPAAFNLFTVGNIIQPGYQEDIQTVIGIDPFVERLTTLEETVDGLELADQSGHIGFLTRDALYADLNFDAGTVAEVGADPIEGKNGTFLKVGASGTGYWKRFTTDLLERVRALEADPNLVVTTIGPGAPVAPTAIAAQYSVFNVTPDTYGRVRGITVNIAAVGSGQLRIQKLRKISAGVYNVVYSSTVTVNTVGENVFMGGADFPETTLFPGEVMAIQYITGGATFNYKNGEGFGYWAYAGIASGNVTYLNTVSGEIYYNVSIETSSLITYSQAGPVYTGAITATAAQYSLFNTEKVQGSVLGVQAHVTAVGSGAMRIQHIYMPTPGTGTVIASYPVTATVTGYNTFTAGVDFPEFELGENEYVAVQYITSGATLTYDNTTGPGYWAYAGVATGAGLTYLQTGPPGEVFLTVFLASPTPPVPPSSSTKDTGTCPLELVADFQALPDGWLNQDSGWTIAGGMVQANTVGKKLRTSRRTGLSRRIIGIPFMLTDAANILTFFTDPLEASNPASGSMVDVSATAMVTQGRYNGTTNLPAVSTDSLGFTIVLNRTYLALWIKNGRSWKFSVERLDGNEEFEFERMAEPLGYSSYPSYGADQGTMQGAPGVMWKSGGATGPVIKSFSHYAIGSRYPLVYILGDSITEGFGVKDKHRYAQRIADLIGVDRVHISGIGGAVASDALTRMQDELLYMRPEYVLIYLGTNFTGGFAADMAAMVSFAQGLGCQVLVATIPTQAGLTADVLALTSTPIPFDMVLTASGAGSPLIDAKYVMTDATGTEYDAGAGAGDSIHPNAFGHLAMADQVFVTVPELLE